MFRRTLPLFHLLVLLGALPSAAIPHVVSVGPGTGCEFADLQSAYDSVPDTIPDVEIRITEGVHGGARLRLDDLAFHVVGYRLTVRGGYSTCSAATASGVSRLSGTHQGPIIEVHAGRLPTGPEPGPILNRTVRLENLILQSNDVTLASGEKFGAGLHATAAIVEVRNVLFTSLFARQRGGAIYLASRDGWLPSLGFGEDVAFFDTAVQAFVPDAPADGGALYCQGDPVLGRISVTGTVESAALTVAEVLGTRGFASGGFATFDHCTASLRFGSAGVASPMAVSKGRPARGGFVAATGSSKVRFDGVLRVQFSEAKSATSLGGGFGGVFHVDAGSTLRAGSLRASDARATSGFGGVIYASGTSSQVDLGCRKPAECGFRALAPSLLERPRASFGGAVAVADFAAVFLHAMIVSEPSAFVTGGLAHLDRGSLLIHHGRLARGRVDNTFAGASSLFEGGTGSQLQLHRVTTVDNDGVDHLIGGEILTNFQFVTLRLPVFAETKAGILEDEGVPVAFSPCGTSSTTARLPSGAASSWNLVSRSDLFDADAVYEHRSAADSPGRDCASPGSGFLESFDIDGDPAAEDEPLDAGADEFVERSRTCSTQGTLLDGPVETLVLDLPRATWVADLRVLLETSGGASSYDVRLQHSGVDVTLAEDLIPGIDPARHVFDDEPDLPSAAPAVFPPVVHFSAEPLVAFDDQRLDAGPWTLRIERKDDEAPATLDRWCLEIAESESRGPFLFADGFESGSVSAWGSP